MIPALARPMTYIHFTGTAACPTLQLKGLTMTQPSIPRETPSFLSLFNCLKRMIPLVNYPRLRFILPDKSRLDFFYFPEDDTVHLHYKEPEWPNIYLGPIESTGHFASRPFPKRSSTHIDALLYHLKLDFPKAVKSYGHLTHLCALCGLPLVDPSSLARGTTPNCTIHLLPPADLEDI